MKFRVVLEYDPETKSYAAYCPELPGCASAGDTEGEALENAKEAISLYLEPAPVQLKPDEKVFEVEVPGTLGVRTPGRQRRLISLAAGRP